MDHPERKTVEVAREHELECLSFGAGIDIATDGLNRRGLAEAREHLGVSNIPCVENPVAALKEGEDPRAQEAMGIRNDADAHRRNAIPLLACPQRRSSADPMNASSTSRTLS
jgi:hypothetical protein